MKKDDLQNKRLDQIGRNLFKTTTFSPDQIEKIVAAPHLYESVKAKIKADERIQSKRFLGNWEYFSCWNLKMTAASGSAVLTAIIIFSVFSNFKTQDSPQLTEHKVKSDFQLAILDGESVLPSNDKETKPPVVKKHSRTIQIAFKPKPSKLPNRMRQPNLMKVLQGAKQPMPEVFYSLAHTGEWEAGGEDLHMIRAELSRSELFALGVNLPVENETAKIKTDLLVGSDGVAKAIRFVEKF